MTHPQLTTEQQTRVDEMKNACWNCNSQLSFLCQHIVVLQDQVAAMDTDVQEARGLGVATAMAVKAVDEAVKAADERLSALPFEIKSEVDDLRMDFAKALDLLSDRVAALEKPTTAPSKKQYLVTVSTNLDDIPVLLTDDLGVAEKLASSPEVWDEARRLASHVLNRDQSKLVGVSIIELENGTPISFGWCADAPDSEEPQPQPVEDEKKPAPELPNPTSEAEKLRAELAEVRRACLHNYACWQEAERKAATLTIGEAAAETDLSVCRDKLERSAHELIQLRAELKDLEENNIRLREELASAKAEVLSRDSALEQHRVLWRADEVKQQYFRETQRSRIDELEANNNQLRVELDQLRVVRNTLQAQLEQNRSRLDCNTAMRAEIEELKEQRDDLAVGLHNTFTAVAKAADVAKRSLDIN